MTERTILRAIVLLSTTPSTDHPIGPLIRMILAIIMALITSVYFLTAAEAEPAVALGVMSTSSTLRKLSAWLKTESLFLAAGTG